MPTKVNWTALKWKPIESDDGTTYARAEVPGGWLVRGPTGLTFVPKGR